jgi:hypothetical protein
MPSLRSMLFAASKNDRGIESLSDQSSQHEQHENDNDPNLAIAHPAPKSPRPLSY